MGRVAVRRVAVAAIAVVAAVVGVGGVLPPMPPRPPCRRASATAAAAVKLPAPAAVGQQAAVATRIAHTTAAGTFEVEVSMTTAVTAVNAADGSYTTRSTIGTVDVPVGAELAGPGVNALVTRSFEQSFTATGAAIPQASTLIDAASMTAEQQQSGRALVDAVSMISVGFPAEPVDGRRGVDVARARSAAMAPSIPVTYQCRLTALDASTYTMEVSYTESSVSRATPGRSRRRSPDGEPSSDRCPTRWWSLPR